MSTKYSQKGNKSKFYPETIVLLKKFMLLSGLPEIEFRKLLGFSRQQWSYYINGQRRITLRRLMEWNKIATDLKIPNDLFRKISTECLDAPSAH